MLHWLREGVPSEIAEFEAQLPLLPDLKKLLLDTISNRLETFKDFHDLMKIQHPR